MNIRFTSTLTADDENLIAPALLKALSSVLDLLPIAYMIRVDTVDGRVFQESGSKRLASPQVETFQPGVSAPTFES